MPKVECYKCKNENDGYPRSGCNYNFRMAANAGGRAVDRKEDVWFCQDYEEKEENEYDG